MKRLRHSAPGYFRALQMSAANVIALVEGQLDRVFYGMLVDRSTSTRPHLQPSVRTAAELQEDAGGGGKTALLAYYDYLRRRSKLVSVLGGKKTVVVFFMDKDLDDLTQRRRRSSHVIYTEVFDVESYLYLHGDLLNAASAATLLDVQTIRAALNPVETWTCRVSLSWEQWVTICVFELVHRCGGVNYSVCPSAVHHANGAVDEARLAARIAQLEQSPNIASGAFNALWTRTCRQVRRLYGRAAGDRVFKGKWYWWFLERDIRVHANNRPANLQGLELRMPTHLLPTLNYDAPWAVRLRARFDGLVDKEIPTV